MQSVSSTIWTRDAVSISYDDNHYTTGTSSGVMVRQLLLISMRFNEWHLVLCYK